MALAEALEHLSRALAELQVALDLLDIENIDEAGMLSSYRIGLTHIESQWREKVLDGEP